MLGVFYYAPWIAHSCLSVRLPGDGYVSHGLVPRPLVVDHRPFTPVVGASALTCQLSMHSRRKHACVNQYHNTPRVLLSAMPLGGRNVPYRRARRPW